MHKKTRETEKKSNRKAIESLKHFYVLIRFMDFLLKFTFLFERFAIKSIVRNTTLKREEFCLKNSLFDQKENLQFNEMK